MADPSLESRLAFLRNVRNSDGGWGYFPGRASWLEPTAYAMLALHGTANSAPELDRAWALIQSWRLPDGSFRAGAQVQDGTWVTALALTLSSVRGAFDDSMRQSVDWLLATRGQEGSLLLRVVSFFHLFHVHADVSHQGWPWRPGNSSWIEPTAHTLIALRKIAPRDESGELRARIREGERMILTRRCHDGGWNYGSSSVYESDLPSYPETTALALLGLQGSRSAELFGSIALAKKQRLETRSPLARAWLDIALRNLGETAPGSNDSGRQSSDIMLTALEALGHPAGNFRLLGGGDRT